MSVTSLRKKLNASVANITDKDKLRAFYPTVIVFDDESEVPDNLDRLSLAALHKRFSTAYGNIENENVLEALLPLSNILEDDEEDAEAEEEEEEEETPAPTKKNKGKLKVEDEEPEEDNDDEEAAPVKKPKKTATKPAAPKKATEIDYSEMKIGELRAVAEKWGLNVKKAKIKTAEEYAAYFDKVETLAKKKGKESLEKMATKAGVDVKRGRGRPPSDEVRAREIIVAMVNAGSAPTGL